MLSIQSRTAVPARTPLNTLVDPPRARPAPAEVASAAAPKAKVPGAQLAIRMATVIRAPPGTPKPVTSAFH